MLNVNNTLQKELNNDKLHGCHICLGGQPFIPFSDEKDAEIDVSGYVFAKPASYYLLLPLDRREGWLTAFDKIVMSEMFLLLT